jgi:protein tyrosine/serine phosphatase
MMHFRSKPWIIAVALAVSAMVFASSARPAQKTNGVSDPAQRLSVSSLPNAAQVTPTLYRGAQPESAGYSQLKQLGIEVVVDFHDQKSEIKEEQARVQAVGMRFISIPWSAHTNPTRAQVISFFGVLRDNPQKKVFIHCEAGADRTGTMIALYRVGLDRWTTEQAVAEMNLFHFHSVRFPHLARYVVAFPAALAADPSLLAGFAPATASSPKP